MELTGSGRPVVERCLEAGLILNCTAERTIRFLPPLIITRDQIDECCTILEAALGQQE